MMSDEEFDLFLENFKMELEENASKPKAGTCPSCGQVLSEAAAEHIQKSKQRDIQSNGAGATEELTR